MAAKSAILIVNKSSNGGYFVELFEYDTPSPPVDERGLRGDDVNNISNTADNVATIKSRLGTWFDAFDAS